VSDPWAVPTQRRQSVAPLVHKIRKVVDAWRASGYPGASPTSRRLLEHWFVDEHQSDGQPFRWYFAQQEAIETLVYLHEVARAHSLAALVSSYATASVAVAPQDFPRYVVKMATGSGKTKVMSLAVTWAYFHALREPESLLSSTSLLIAPNLIVYERLREDVGHARVWRTDPLLPPEWRADFDLQVCLRGDPVPLQAPGVLMLTNVQQLYDRPAPAPGNPLDAVLGRRPPRDLTASEPPLNQIAARGRVLVLNDEAHHLHDEVKGELGEPLRAIQTIERLNDLGTHLLGGVAAQLDFSATPRNNQGEVFPETVVDYPLAQAIEDGIVKRPVIGEIVGGAVEVTSDDAAVRFRQQILTGVEKWREFADALAPAGKKPLLFVMAENTAAADQVAAYLDTVTGLAGKVLTIHVNLSGNARGEIRAAELESAREAARQVDGDDSPYAAIVSVLMLREGWDVRNVSVIVPLRALSSKNAILPEQTLGRGLRRMTPPGAADETVVVIEHEAFRQLWDRALDDEGLEIERRPSDTVHPDALVIAVEPQRIAYDIAIPSLPRTLVRHASGLTALRPEDLPAREVVLPEELQSAGVEYVGRDMLTGVEVDRATYALDRPFDPGAVLAWFVNEVQRDARLTGQFATLAPLVRGYIERRTFSGPVDLDDPLVLHALEIPANRETILGVLRHAVDEATLQQDVVVATEAKELLLSTTRPFLWSGETAQAVKSVFSQQPCDSGLEVSFCGFLDRCADVAAFAKLAREVRFSLEYRADGGRLAYYYPDFVVRLESGAHLLLETKGIADLDVPHKDERAARWAVDASIASGVRWTYARVDEAPFRQHEAALTSVVGLVELVEAGVRNQVLASLDRPTSARTRANALARQQLLAQRLSGVGGGDEAIRAGRESLGE